RTSAVSALATLRCSSAPCLPRRKGQPIRIAAPPLRFFPAASVPVPRGRDPDSPSASARRKKYRETKYRFLRPQKASAIPPPLLLLRGAPWPRRRAAPRCAPAEPAHGPCQGAATTPLPLQSLSPVARSANTPALLAPSC